MKSAFIIFLIISFLGVAIFGFVSMIFGDIHNGGCIAENRLGAPCPLNGAFTFVVFHLDAFKYFSTPTLDAFADLVGIPSPDKETNSLKFYRPKEP